MTPLDDNTIEQNLSELDGWRREADTIVREFEHDDFMGSVRFVNALAEAAEEMNHHPDLAISWNKVTVSLSTHSEGGLTEADFKLASKIEKLGETG